MSQWQEKFSIYDIQSTVGLSPEILFRCEDTTHTQLEFGHWINAEEEKKTLTDFQTLFRRFHHLPLCSAGAGVSWRWAPLVTGWTHTRRGPDGTRSLTLLFRVGLRIKPWARPHRRLHLPAAFSQSPSSQPPQPPQPSSWRQQAGGEPNSHSSPQVFQV